MPRMTSAEYMAYEDKHAKRTYSATPEAAQASADSQSEAELQDLVANYLRVIGAKATPQPFGKRTTAPPGTADFTVCYKGLYLAVECKVGRNDLTPDQEREKVEIQAAGGYYLVCRDLSELRDLIRGIDARFDVPCP